MLWPAEGVTKQGLGDYYAAIADRIMPHLIGRPLSLVRCPNGLAAKCFFAKHEWAGLGEAVRRVDVPGEEPLLSIDTPAGLLALVQGSVLEIHPWGSQIAELGRPDRLIFDLDPDEEISWSAVIDAAREVRERLKADLKIESFVKTTGGKGLHVVVPLIPSIDWDAAKSICKRVADTMSADSPARYVSHMGKRARTGKIFIDYLRNGWGATAVAPYSTRARAGAAVSTPLAWDELSEAVKSDHFRLSNIERRVARTESDPWAEFFTIKQKPRAPGRTRTSKTSGEARKIGS
jgi:bifunctional non-homologous end joining protein LigD